MLPTSGFYESLEQTDFEHWLSIFLKSLEQGNFSVRREVANLVATFLIYGYSQPLKQNPKKKKKKSVANATSPTDGIEHEQTLTLSLSDLCNYLCIAYCKATYRETAVGIVECFAEFLSRLGPTVIVAHYITLVENITKLADEKINSTRSDLVRSRKMCIFLLHDIIGRQMLSETAKIVAVKELVDEFLVTRMKEVENVTCDKSTLVCVLYTISHLLVDLGNAAVGLEVNIIHTNCRLLTTNLQIEFGV
jgi:hypothetical protein